MAGLEFLFMHKTSYPTGGVVVVVVLAAAIIWPDLIDSFFIQPQLNLGHSSWSTPVYLNSVFTAQILR